ASESLAHCAYPVTPVLHIEHAQYDALGFVQTRAFQQIHPERDMRLTLELADFKCDSIALDGSADLFAFHIYQSGGSSRPPDEHLFFQFAFPFIALPREGRGRTRWHGQWRGGYEALVDSAGPLVARKFIKHAKLLRREKLLG